MIGGSLALGLVAAAVAFASHPSYSTKVILNPDLDTLHGKLQSSKQDCVKNRTVRLVDKRLEHPDTPVGSPAKSDKHGHWVIENPGEPYPDTYGAYVKAGAKDHDKFLCKSGQREIGGS